jgi:hypothetical protein
VARAVLYAAGMKKTIAPKKLKLTKNTLRNLGADLAAVRGGAISVIVTISGCTHDKACN